MALQEPFWNDEHPMLRMSRKTKENEFSQEDVSVKLEDAFCDGSTSNRYSGLVLSSPEIMMTTWQKRDWQQFYELARRPWRRHRPPRPVYPSGLNRVAPAQGYSLSELDDAGVDLDLAERLGLPVDAGRIGVYGPNVTVLKEFVRSNRHPL
jgi:ribosomal protein L13E